MSRTDNPQESAEQPARPVRREPKPLDAKNALLALNRREPEAPRRASEADALETLETLDTERILELPRRKDERKEEPAPVTPLPVARRSRGMTMLGEATASYVARLPRRSSSEPMAMASERQGERQSTPSRRKTAPPQPEVCPICHGAGYVRLEVPVGHPDFGRAVQCECKEREIAERERLKLRAVSSLKPFDKKTFSTFDPEIPSKSETNSVREAYKVALRYAEDPVGWLILQGGYGCGKTHLAAAIAHQREDEGDTVFFSIVPDLLDHLRAAFAPTSELTYDALFERVRESGLLVLDDLGAENGTAWATEKLFQLINYRYNYRMPTVITTNARLMSHMDERIRSRLNDRGLVRYVQIEAQDYRERHAGRPSRGSGGSRGRGSYTR
jgi:DNA replication protein DnaC